MIRAQLCFVDTDSPMNWDAMKLYLADKEKYKKVAAEHAQKHSKEFDLKKYRSIFL